MSELYFHYELRDDNINHNMSPVILPSCYAIKIGHLVHNNCYSAFLPFFGHFHLMFICDDYELLTFTSCEFMIVTTFPLLLSFKAMDALLPLEGVQIFIMNKHAKKPCDSLRIC